MLLCAMGLIPIIRAVVSVSCPSDLVNCLSVILKENFFEVDLAVQEMLIAKKGYDFANGFLIIPVNLPEFSIQHCLASGKFISANCRLGRTFETSQYI